MASRRKTRFAAAVCAAAVAVSLGTSAVFAGEVNGAGTKDDFSKGRSECKYSGLNDDPGEAFPFGGRVQSYGYSVVKNGLKDFVDNVLGLSPGVACNPNSGASE